MSRGPTTAASGCASANRASSSIASSTTHASELRRKKYRPRATRIPALLPPPIPTLSCSIRRTAANRSRTSSTLPSVDPLSTTIASYPSTDSRQRSSHGSASYVTTTTVTSSRIALDRRRRRAPHALPQDHGEPRQRDRDRQQEEQEADGERRVRVDADPLEEADEECLAHRSPLIVKGTSITRKSNGPSTKYGRTE